MMESGPSPKFAAIEGLRGWMAWWVVLGHGVEVTGLGARLHPLVATVLSSSYMAVQLFMIVSGFVIAHVLLVRPESYGRYIARRWFRLMPLMLALAALAIVTRQLYAVAWIDNPWALGATRIDRMRAEEALWPVHLLLHLALLHGAIPESVLPFASTTFLAPAWSLSLEWQFYLIAPLLAASLMSASRPWFAALLVVLSLPTLLGAVGTWYGSQSFLLQNLPFFFVGIASRHVLERPLPISTISCCVVATVIYIGGRGLNQVALLMPVAALWAFFLLLSAREAGKVSVRSRWLDGIAWLLAYNRGIAELGKLSYATYLCHVPVFSIVIGVGLVAFARADQAFVVCLTLAASVVSLAMSKVLHILVERPGMLAGKRLLSQARGARAPGPTR